MSKTRLSIMVLILCLVLGTIPFAMGATPTTSGSNSILFVTGATPTASISNLYVGASGQTANQEYIQITNTGTTAVNLNGWKIKDQDALHVYTFSYTLKAKSTVTLRSGNGKNTATTLYWNKYSFIWNNTGDKVSLYDAQGKLVSTKVGSKVK